MNLDAELKNDFYRSIFDGKSLKINGLPVGKVVVDSDQGQHYVINSHGFRGEEFSSSDNLLTAGCSYTFGMGVPIEAVWWTSVAEHFGLSSSASVSRPGASVSWIVEKLFAYFAEFGNPKYLLCLFPGFDRFVIPLDGEILDTTPSIGHVMGGDPGTFGDPGQRFYTSRAKMKPQLLETKYLKRPYKIENIYTEEITTYDAIRSIRFLEQYCAATNIKLLWTTWDNEARIALDHVNKIENLRFKNYFDLKFFSYKKTSFSETRDFILMDEPKLDPSKYYECVGFHSKMECSCPSIAPSCHQDLLEIYGKKNYNIGTDTVRGDEYAHPGVHLQAHYADRFIEELMLEYPQG